MKKKLLFLTTQDIYMISDEVYNYNLEQNFPLHEAHVIPSAYSRHFPATLGIVDVQYIYSVAGY